MVFDEIVFQLQEDQVEITKENKLYIWDTDNHQLIKQANHGFAEIT